MSWHKTGGGDTLVWVGFEFLLRSRRAEWFARWTKKMASSAIVHMASFEEGLGRIMFVAGALEHERPFLGPLFRFIGMHPRNAVRRIPSYVAFILRYLSCEIAKKRHHLCGTRITASECIPRVDAHASARQTGIGGWFPARNEKGELVPWCSDWFSLEITKEDFPWIFEKRDRPSLVISTLEALAMLVALKLRFRDSPDLDDTKVLVVPSVTDNRGNGAALNKPLSIRFPSSALFNGVGFIHENERNENGGGVGTARIEHGS